MISIKLNNSYFIEHLDSIYIYILGESGKKLIIFGLNIIIAYKFLNIDPKYNSLLLLGQFPI